MVVTMESWLEAQQAVIGSALIDSKVVPAIISGTTEDDYTGHCRTVFLAIKSIFASGAPVDPVVVKDRLGDAYTGFLMQLMEITPTAANIDVYISLCRDRGRLLRLRELGQQMQEADSLDAAASLVEQANRVMVQRTTTQVVTMESALRSFYDRHDGAVSYLSWPIKELNGKLYAESGDFIILGGYPSDGKSAFAIQTACHMAKSKRVGFFSLETNPNKLFDRMIAHVAGIPMESMKTNTMTQGQWDDAAKASEHILSLQLEYVPASGYSVSDIRAMSIANRYDVIFVDYLQLVQGSGRDRYSVVTEVSIGLHQMAQSTGITVIALAQLSRPEKKKDTATPPPQLSDLRESGQIEQDADIVFMLYRPKFEQEDRILLVRKNKEGELGSIALDFDGQRQTFSRKKTNPYAGMPRKPKPTVVLGCPQQVIDLPDDFPVPF
jgi:replicative DNA helicase